MPEADRFWLLTGDLPAGPFTLPEVHALLAAGGATWQTPACPVGGGTWLPLLKTPGIGPAPAVPLPQWGGGHRRPGLPPRLPGLPLRRRHTAPERGIRAVADGRRGAAACRPGRGRPHPRPVGRRRPPVLPGPGRATRGPA